MVRHRQLKSDIDGHEDDFKELMELGRRETAGQTDDQYKYLESRLDKLEEHWKGLHYMYDQRTAALEQSVEAQVCSIGSTLAHYAGLYPAHSFYVCFCFPTTMINIPL